MATAIQINGETIYTISSGGGGAISLHSGEDEFTNIGNGTEVSEVLNLNPDDASETSLISAINGSNYLKALEMKANIHLQAKNTELKSREVDNLKANALVNAELLLQTETNTQVQAEILNNLMNLNENIKALTLATKNQQLQLNTSSISMGNVSLDTSPIVEALNSGVQNQISTNLKIVEGINSQTQTNAKIVENLEKKNDHLDYLKNGTETLKDSNGNVIKPREIEAQKNAEQFIDKESINKTTAEEIMEFNQEWRQMLEDYSVESVFSDAVGSTDGFIDKLNPFKFFDDILSEDFKEQINKLNK